MSPVGHKVSKIRAGDLSTALTLTLLTDLSPTAPRPIYADIRYNSNTQRDFLLFVCDVLDAGHLVAGDYFIIDNASVHRGEASFDILLDLLESAGVQLVFLPKYSPEFNPCELVFGKIKKHLRFYRKTDDFYWELVRQCALVEKEDLWAFYYHCRFNW